MRRLKAMFCYYGPNVLGGPTSWVRRMLPRLRNRNMDVVAVPYHTASGTCRVSRHLDKCGIKVREVLAADLSPMEGVHRMASIIASEAPDVCVADHVLPAFIAGNWVKHYGIPTVMVVRNDDSWYHDLVSMFVQGDGKLRVGGVVTVSRELEQKIRPQLTPGTAFMRCPSSVPLPSTTSEWEPGRFHAIYLGRFEQQQKRILDLVKALVQTSQDLPWFSATLYGDGPLCGDVEQMLTQVSGHRVAFGGLLQETQVYPQLLTSQALVLLSAYEGLSSAVQEAMACGLPIIARRTNSGMAGVLSHGINSWIIDEDAALTEAVHSLANSRESWYRLSRNARKLAEREFDIEKSADRWKSFLERLTDNHLTKRVPLPREQETERVFLNYLASKQRLDIWEADLLITRAGTCGRGSPAIFQDQLQDWDGRRCLLYRALENGIITNNEAAPIAERLALESERQTSVDIKRRYHLASLFLISGDMDRARLLFESFLPESADSDMKAGSLFHLGWITFRQDNMKEASRLLNRCLAICPAHRAAKALLNEVTLQNHMPNEPAAKSAE